ncbi:uncharacterized protein OCT59_005718 [Rhizophagus irregularis]|uniref:uncharacterized protein n=1 Tax=Rhizophagus irregularis TaxID=588596 RepID=UPI0033326E7A|nr:hypothetical protein OCT59_005718 [Rhizophagus irregularis]
MMSSDLFRPKIDTTVRRNRRSIKTTQTNLCTFLRNYVDSAASSKSRRVRNWEYGNYATNEIDAPINAPRWTKDGYNGSLKQLIEKYSENKCSSPEEADENQDLPEEDDQAGEDENQEVVDENQEEVDKNQEEVKENQEDEENQKDEEEDQNKNKRGVSVVSSEYDSISSK